MRRLILVVAVTILAVACTPSGDDSPTTIDTTASTTTDSGAVAGTTEVFDGTGGEVVIGTETPIASLNPFSPNAFSGRLAGNAVWALVYDIDPETWERTPDSVTGLPSQTGDIELNDDGTMTVRYEIRQGLQWSDGQPITGADLAFTAEAMRDLAASGTGGVDPVMASVVATDSVDRLAFITFEEPTLAFEDALWIILPSHSLAEVDLVDGTDGSEWPSGGPFVVESFDPAGETRFVRNDRYGRADDLGESLPYLDALTIAGPAQEPGSPVPGFLERSFDVITVNPLPADLAAVEDAAGDGAILASALSPVIEQITFQFGDGRDAVNPDSLNDARAYREAVASAIDRSALVAETDVPWSDTVPGLLVPVGSSAWSSYPFDPDGAAVLVASVAGDTSAQARLSTTGNGDYRIRIGDALGSSFEAIGVVYEPIYSDSVVFYGEDLGAGTFDIGMWAWLNDGGFSSTLRLLDVFDPAGDGTTSNFGRWTGGDAGTRYSEIVAEAHATVDAERFADLIAEAEDILARELPVIPLFNRGVHAAYWSDTVSGVVANGSPSDLTWNVEVWKRIG